MCVVPCDLVLFAFGLSHWLVWKHLTNKMGEVYSIIIFVWCPYYSQNKALQCYKLRDYLFRPDTAGQNLLSLTW